MLMECKMHQQMEVQTMVCKLQGWSVIQSCFPVFGFILCFSFVCFSVYPVGDVSSSVFFHLLYPLQLSLLFTLSVNGAANGDHVASGPLMNEGSGNALHHPVRCKKFLNFCQIKYSHMIRGVNMGQNLIIRHKILILNPLPGNEQSVCLFSACRIAVCYQGASQSMNMRIFLLNYALF